MRIKRNKTHQKTKRRKRKKEKETVLLLKMMTARKERSADVCSAHAHNSLKKKDDVIQKLRNSFSYSGPGLRVCGLKEDVKMATPQVDDKGDVVLMDASSKEVKWDPFQSPDWDLEKPTSEAIVRIKRYFLL